jgi:hypothetical protein
MDNQSNSKEITSISQLIATYFVAKAIIKLREGFKEEILDKELEVKIPSLKIPDGYNNINELYKRYAKITNYNPNLILICKIGLESLFEYNFIETSSVPSVSANETEHLKDFFGKDYELLSQVNLFEHTINVFTTGLIEAENKGRTLQVAIPLLGCLYHDFGKSENIRDTLGASPNARHAEVSGDFVSHILFDKMRDYISFKENEFTMDEIETLKRLVTNHHQKNTKESGVKFIKKADTASRAQELRKLKINSNRIE